MDCCLMCLDAQGGKDFHVNSLVTCSPEFRSCKRLWSPSPYPYFQAMIMASYTSAFLSKKKFNISQPIYPLPSLVFSKDFIVSTSLVWSSDPRSAVCVGNSSCHAHKLPRCKAWKDQNNSLGEISPLYIAFPIWS